MASSASTLARLTLDRKEYNVFQAMFESMKPVDQWNRVTAYATKADARFVIEGTEETATLFEKYYKIPPNPPELKANALKAKEWLADADNVKYEVWRYEVDRTTGDIISGPEITDWVSK